MAEQYNVTEETIKRDISDIRFLYGDNHSAIIYNRTENAYQLVESEDVLSIQDCLLILTILYRSRGLNSKEMDELSHKLIKLFSDYEQIRIRKFFTSFKHHYKPIQEKDMLDLIYLVARKKG